MDKRKDDSDIWEELFMKHQPYELAQMQSLPLELKVRMTQRRIREWYDHWDGEVYVSFSGGKDSTALLHIARNMYPDIPAVFCDTGLEYPEIRDFVRSFDNITWIRPKMSFKKVIETYGYPFVSKEVSFALANAKRFLENPDKYKDKKPLPVQNPDDEYKPYALLRLEGKIGSSGKGFSQFNCQKWHFMLDAPWKFSSKCCDVMKKEPFKVYEKETWRKPITAQMAIESRLRKKNWFLHGCNAFDASKPMSNPMSFWTEQDVLEYIKEQQLEIASVYGDIVYLGKDGTEYYDAMISDGFKLKTTGLDRTGCMFCGYGCHLEDSEKGRFKLMKKTHPKQYEYIMRPRCNGGLGYKEVIDWINHNGGTNITY